MTQAISVRCQNCGSPLQVSGSVRFITCAYCHSELEVVRDATTVHTEVLQRIEQNTEATVNRLKIIELQNEVERLDREWEMWRETHLPRSKSGRLEEPAPVATGVFGIGVVVFVLFWIGLAFTLTAQIPIPGPFRLVFPFFGVFVLAGVIFNMVKANSTGSGYKEARQAYESKRAELLARMEKDRGSSS